MNTPVAVYDPAHVVRVVLADLTSHGVPVAFGPASLAKAAELAQAMLRQFDVEALAEDDDADVPFTAPPVRYAGRGRRRTVRTWRFSGPVNS